jgi:type IV pilus assembly protein PilV
VAMQSGYDALQRVQAVFLANDILERMRSNPAALDSYDADSGVDGADTSWRILGGGTLQTPNVDCLNAACTATELAAYDLWTWEQAIDGARVKQTDDSNVGGLAQPTGCIRQTQGGRIEIAVAWLGRSELANPDLATGCTVSGRYGQDDAFRRVILVRSFIGGSN